MVTIKIENRVIDKLDSSIFSNATSLHINNSIIKIIDLRFLELEIEVLIENSLIHKLDIHSCWFKKGITLKRNHIFEPIDYQMGGHNKAPIVIVENIFSGFINFFDCDFMADLEMGRNLFLDDSNLLGNLDMGFKNTFAKTPLIYDNIGLLNVDRVK